jgi:hypothetical protein
MTQTEIWTLVGVNGALLGVTGFFIKQWINGVMEDSKTNKEEIAEHKDRVSDDINQIRNELGKRKGETELLRKDLELLASETRKNFEGVNIHMNYQKGVLDDIKKSVETGSKAEVSAITQLVSLLNKERGDGK